MTLILALREQQHLFTVLEKGENGKVAQRAVLDFAWLISPALAAWIDREVAFPSTIVDRMVPATTAQTLNDMSEGCRRRRSLRCCLRSLYSVGCGGSLYTG
ncbi:MAG: hypothetical protein ACSLEN_01105 [Candidatus Malihini olakiniferum]